MNARAWLPWLLAGACSRTGEPAPAGTTDASPAAAGDALEVDAPPTSVVTSTAPTTVEPELEPLPMTALPLTLLATQVPADASLARATIRDGDAGTIAHYRVGDAIRKDVLIVAIDQGHVELVHDELRERLEVGATPAKLDPRDVFYADFVEDGEPSDMRDAVQLGEGPGWMIKTPAFAWGTRRTVHRLRESLRAYVRVAEGGPDVHVGDLSKAGGGPFPPHLSHRTGRDVDVGYVLSGRDADVARFVRTSAANLDRARTWKLVKAMIDTRAVAWIFMDYRVQELLYEHALHGGTPRETLESLFQYPHGDRAMHGIIRDWRGHDDHFHVRWAE